MAAIIGTVLATTAMTVTTLPSIMAPQTSTTGDITAMSTDVAILMVQTMATATVVAMGTLLTFETGNVVVIVIDLPIDEVDVAQ